MILLVASSLALLVVYAGVKLLIQSKKETLGHLYHCASWFFIIAGFLILACAGACCIAMCCKYGTHMMHQKHMMADDEEDEHMHKGYNQMKMMKFHHHEKEDGCMVHINCYGDMEKSCKYIDFCKMDTVKGNK